MPVPNLNLWAPGVGVFSSDWANTLMQGGCYLSNLRAFSGVQNQTVQMVGFAAISDGGQGTFVWNTGTGYVDDGGVTTIVPNGVPGNGAWLRQIPGYVAAYGSTVTSVTNIAALRAATSTTLGSGLAFVLGYFAGADGGEGMFWSNAADTSSADNSGTIIVDASGRRWYREASGSMKNIRWFGGNPNVADCTAALNAALATITAPGGIVFFPKGIYNFLSAINYTFSQAAIFSIGILGEAADVTILNWPTTSGIAFSGISPLNSIHFRDLTISTGSASSSTIGVSLTNAVQGGDFAQSDFTRCTFRGADGGAAVDYWGSCISVNGWSGIDYLACTFYGPSAALNGIGVVAAGQPSGGFKYSLIHNLNSCSFFNLSIGFEYGTYVQGVAVIDCNFTSGITDIFVPVTEQNGAQLTIVGCQFAGNGTASSARILINGPLPALLMTSNLLFVAANTIGLTMNNTVIQACISSNVFNGQSITNSFGINVSSAGQGVITGNNFYGLGNGVDLAGSATGFNVQANIYPNCTNTVLSPGSNQVGVATQ